MTRMTGPDCVVMCNLINTYIHTYIHTYGSIFTSIFLVKVVWDKISGHTWRRASVTTSHCVEHIGVYVVADSDAVLGSEDKKNLRSYSS